MFGNLTALQNLYKRVVLDAAQPHRWIYRCLQCLDALLVGCWTNWKDWIVQPKITSLCLIEWNTIHFKTECFCFSSQQLSAVSSCLDTWTFLNFQRQKKKHHTPPSSFYSLFSIHIHLTSCWGRSVLDGCLKAKSLGAAAPLQHLSLWAVWLSKAESAGMCVHVCACHIWYSTPAQSVFLCPPCRISHLKYSGGCRNALINTVALQLPFLCIYEAEPSRFGPMTDLTMCRFSWRPCHLRKLPNNPCFFFCVFFYEICLFSRVLTSIFQILPGFSTKDRSFSASLKYQWCEV